MTFFYIIVEVLWFRNQFNFRAVNIDPFAFYFEKKNSISIIERIFQNAIEWAELLIPLISRPIINNTISNNYVIVSF